MSTACELGLALMTTCATLPPSGRPPVEVTQACIKQYTREERVAAIECAAENNVTWRIVRRRK